MRDKGYGIQRGPRRMIAWAIRTPSMESWRSEKRRLKRERQAAFRRKKSFSSEKT